MFVRARPLSCHAAGWGHEYPAQLGPGPHGEFAVHPGEVGFDGALPHEQFGGDLSVGTACGDEFGHALLGGGEDLPCSRRDGMCSHSAEFVPDAVLPQWGTEPLEDHQGSLEEPQGLVLAACPPVNLPGGKKRPCLFEWHRQPLVYRERCIK